MNWIINKNVSTLCIKLLVIHYENVMACQCILPWFHYSRLLLSTIPSFLDHIPVHCKCYIHKTNTKVLLQYPTFMAHGKLTQNWFFFFTYIIIIIILILILLLVPEKCAQEMIFALIINSKYMLTTTVPKKNFWANIQMPI